MVNEDPSGITRRSLLRKGVATTGVAVVGITTLSGTALASDCPRTPGFWANHDWCEVVANPKTGTSVAESIDSLTCHEDGSVTGTYSLQSGVKKTMERWQAFLVSPARGDKATILAKQLLAAKLNAFRRHNPDRDCFDKSIDLSAYGIDDPSTYGQVLSDDPTVRTVVNRASAWLGSSAFGTEATQRDWVVSDIYNAPEGPVDGEPLKDILDDFNNGRLDLDCGCNGDDSDRERPDGNGPNGNGPNGNGPNGNGPNGNGPNGNGPNGN